MHRDKKTPKTSLRRENLRAVLLMVAIAVVCGGLGLLVSLLTASDDPEAYDLPPEVEALVPQSKGQVTGTGTSDDPSRSGTRP